MRLHRDDFRLGAPPSAGPALDHLCPVCDGEGDPQLCYCNGLGVISAADAAEFEADDPDPRSRARALPAVPTFTGRPCSDCAFRSGSPERDRGMGTAAGLFDSLAGQPFFCHAGMHDGARGYEPRQRDKSGAPIGHPICAGWLAQYTRALR